MPLKDNYEEVEMDLDSETDSPGKYCEIVRLTHQVQYSSRVLGQKRDRTSALLALYSGESSVAYSMAIA